MKQKKYIYKIKIVTILQEHRKYMHLQLNLMDPLRYIVQKCILKI